MNDSADLRAEYLALRQRIDGATLSTLGDDQTPEASYAPLLWHDGACYLYLSDLAGHTRNLRRHPRLGLLLLDDAAGAATAFARRRIVLTGCAEEVGDDDRRRGQILGKFRRRFGKVMELIEPLPDFHLFRVVPEGGRYIRGFGQAYDLDGPGLDRLRHVGPG